LTVNAARTRLLLPLLIGALAACGCDEAATTTATNVTESPANVISPAAPDETKSAAATADPTKKAADATSKADAATGSTPAGKVELVLLNYDEMRKRFASGTKGKLTMVDAWATWCAPCKESFPHVVAMHKKYADQGLNVVSLSLDDSTDAQAVAAARKFLEEQQATFTNYLLTDEQGTAFEKLSVNTIPSVFLFSPEGQEIKRFTWDDPNNQFTYEQVEQTVAAMLKGEPIPSGNAAEKK
jgi:thiol-disulfide isomerase/thioredoxin